MKRITLTMLLLSFTASVHANNLRALGHGLLDQATRKSSCTYSLTIHGVTSDKTEVVKRTAITKNEACALAKTACNKIGNDRGIFGRHTCEKENEDGGGIITRAVEGDIPSSSSQTRTSYASEVNRIKQENSALREDLAHKVSIIRSLRSDLNSRAGSNLELDNNELKVQISSLNRKVRIKNYTISSLNKEVSRLKRELRLINGDQDVSGKPTLTASQISACDRATASLDMEECLKLSKKYELSTEVIAACDRAAPSHELGICLEASGQINAPNMKEIISMCDIATGTVQELVGCMEYSK